VGRRDGIQGLSVVKKAKYDKNSVYFACRWAVNHSSVLLKPRERGCFAYFHHKNGYGVGACHGKPLQHAKLTLKIGRSTPFMGFWWRRQVVHRLPNLRKIIKTTTDKPYMPSAGAGGIGAFFIIT